MYTRAIAPATKVSPRSASSRISSTLLAHYAHFTDAPNVRGRLRHSRGITTLGDRQGQTSTLRVPSSQVLNVDQELSETSTHGAEETVAVAPEDLEFHTSLTHSHQEQGVPETSKQTAEQNSSFVSASADVKPLPTLPPFQEQPCPLLTQSEMDTYLPVLYSRKWGVSRQGVEVTDGKENKEATVAMLIAVFCFQSREHVTKFFANVTEIAKSEQQTPTFDIDPVEHIVTFRTHTSSAHFLPETNDRSTGTYSALRSEIDSEEDVSNRQTSGITLRDVRLAILLEQLFDEEVTAGRGFRKQHPLTSQRPKQASYLGLWWTAPKTHKRVCKVCGRGHSSQSCPLRLKGIGKRPLPCPLCGGLHRGEVCPSSERPPRPCQRCGGVHLPAGCPALHPTPAPQLPIRENAEVLDVTVGSEKDFIWRPRRWPSDRSQAKRKGNDW